MIQLNIHVDLLPDKLSEFMQSWESFSQHMKNDNCLISHTIKPSGKFAYDIEFICSEQKQIEQLRANVWYEFLIGAMETLGNSNSSNQVKLDN